MSRINPTNYKFIDGQEYLPAGEYVVIDPCYVIGEEPFWGDFVDFSFPEGVKGGRQQFFIELDGKLAYTFSTAYGDGRYPVIHHGVRQGAAAVDAGCLALIPKSYLDENDLDYSLGVVVKLDHDTMPEYEGGDVTCDDIAVITSGRDDAEDDWTTPEDEEEEVMA